MGSEITYQRESFDDCISDAMPLLSQHYREIATHQDIPLAVNCEVYRDLERMDMLRIFTAREAVEVVEGQIVPRGRLVGYSVFLVSRNAHYWTSLQAKNDVIYVDPSRRGAMIGLRLIGFAEGSLAAEGVQVATYHVKHAHPILARLLEKVGYVDDERMMQKRLDLKGA